MRCYSLAFRRWAPLVAASLLAAASLAQYKGAQIVPTTHSAGFSAITEKDCREWLNYLAGPECAGRGSGQDGYQKAAEFMAQKFKEFGLKPGGDEDTFFQNLDFKRSRVKADSNLTVGDLKLVQGKGVSVSGAAEDTDIEGEVVFLRAQGQDAALPEGFSAEGKILVVSAADVPRNFQFGMRRTGAALVINVVDKVSASNDWNITYGDRGGRGRLSVSVDQATARRLAQALGADESSVTPGAFAAIPGIGMLKVSAKVESQTVEVPNVVGILEGSDPSLAPEHVGIGAHLDHLGTRNGQVFYGADDDASGNTALLAVAKAFHVSGVKPKRSIVFMAFCGEEMGLIGSRHYAANPKIPLDKMICELQMDMVGRNEHHGETEKAEDNVNTIHLVGSKRISTELHELILAQNKFVNFEFEYDEEDVYTRSDHYSFADKGVPIAFVFSGFHPDYHQASDTPDKINFEKIVNSAKLFYLVAREAADREKPFAKDVINSGGGGG